jgi:hypothetical protein
MNINPYIFRGRSFLEALRRMNAPGLLSIPPQRPQGGYRPMKLISEEEVGFKPPEREITGSVGDMGRIHFELVKTEKKERLWRLYCDPLGVDTPKV